jgi:transmembrane sensor
MERDYYNLPDFVLRLLAAKASGKLTSEQEMQLQNWLSQNPQHMAKSEELLGLLQKQHYLHLRSQVNEAQGWKAIQQKIHPQKTIRTLAWKWSKYAAALLVIMSFAWYLRTTVKTTSKETAQVHIQKVERNNKAVLVLSDGSEMVLDNPGDTLLKESGGITIKNLPGQMLAYDQSQINPDEKSINKLVVPAGARYEIRLSDGTKVWMNSVSQLEYPLAFGKSQRKIKLTGEAFFEVAKDATRPFIIDANGYEIKVLGTSFNVSVYPADNFMETTLVNGAVEITGKGGKVISLKPAQMARVDNADQSIAIETVDTRYFTSWKDGIMYFDNMPLEDLTTKLERWYCVKITYKNEKPKRLHFSGALENSRDIQFLLNLISQTTHVKFEVKDKLITVE